MRIPRSSTQPSKNSQKLMHKQSSYPVSSMHTVTLGGHRVRYRLVLSRTARKLRIRIGPRGIDVIHPSERPITHIKAFLRANQKWVLGQLGRVRSIRVARSLSPTAQILFRGTPTPVEVISAPERRSNKVSFNGERLFILAGNSRVSPGKSLEYWFRRRARMEISQQLNEFTRRLKCVPQNVFIRGQRTKWGNCSSRRNLSFNWRLILAPSFVLQYVVAHELTHLKVSNHSTRFWLIVQSLCPRATEAKRWLSQNGERLMSSESIAD